MKKLLFTVAAFSFVAFSYAQKKADELGKFKSETIDMGKLQQGTPTTAIFTVANIGNTPLIIEQANPTCGCTISDSRSTNPLSNRGSNGRRRNRFERRGCWP